MPILTLLSNLGMGGGGGVAAPMLGGVWQAWESQKGLTPALRKKIRKQFSQPPIKRVIAENVANIDSMEAQEKELRKIFKQARIEYQDIYLRLLAHEIERARQEEDAIVTTLMALL